VLEICHHYMIAAVITITNNNNNIIIIIIIIVMTMIMGQCLQCRHHGRAIVRVSRVHVMNVKYLKMAASCRPTDEAM